MAQTKVQLVSNIIGNVSGGASFTGIVTASSFIGDGSSLTGVGIGTDGSINTTGIVTASSFIGDGSSLTGVGIGTDGSINTTGIITASGGFNIGIQSTGQDIATGVITAFNFVGAGNTFLYNAETKTIDINIAGGGGAFNPVNYIL